MICFLKIHKQRVSSGIFVFLKEAKLPFDRLTKIICFIQWLKQAMFPSKSLTRISVFQKRAVRGLRGARILKFNSIRTDILTKN